MYTSKNAIEVSAAPLHKRSALTNLSPQGFIMKKLIKLLWHAWNEARIAYAKRYVQHRLGS
jgi:hypothetical protein